ncbi:hypothetical protein AAC387_Pa04g0795 [Persea americana]
MALAISLSRCVFFPPHHLSILDSQTTPRTSLSTSKPLRHFPSVASHQAQIVLDRRAIAVAEAVSEAELWAAACLRVRSFYDFDPTTYAVEFSENGDDRVVVGTLDLNQCLRLADEITGKRPEGIGADFARAYLSNVCVAKEVHRKGVGYALVAKSKKVAQEWGITDLYAHVAVDNEPAKNLYMKSGFVYESDEPAWQARFLERSRRLLLWVDLT